MSDTKTDPVRELLVDSFTRVKDLVEGLTHGLTLELATWRADEEANPISWLVWHLTRIQDDHVAGIAGEEQVWPQWRDRFGLPFGPWALGYGQSSAEAGQVHVSGELLAGYHADVHQQTLRYLDRVDETELTRVVDDSWTPPVTASIRLVSVIGDTLQHLGQAAYVKGLANRAGVA
ncbi:MAG: mycothiol transferase [Janthinobacterium lividum]